MSGSSTAASPPSDPTARRSRLVASLRALLSNDSIDLDRFRPRSPWPVGGVGQDGLAPDLSSSTTCPGGGSEHEQQQQQHADMSQALLQASMEAATTTLPLDTLPIDSLDALANLSAPLTDPLSQCLLGGGGGDHGVQQQRDMDLLSSLTACDSDAVFPSLHHPSLVSASVPSSEPTSWPPPPSWPWTELDGASHPDPASTNPHGASGRSAPKRAERPHYVVEKRYRASLNERFEALRHCVQSRKQSHHQQQAAAAATPLPSSAPATPCGGGASKLNKGEVLHEAVLYIEQLEEENEVLLDHLKLVIRRIRATKNALHSESDLDFAT